MLGSNNISDVLDRYKSLKQFRERMVGSRKKLRNKEQISTSYKFSMMCLAPTTCRTSWMMTRRRISLPEMFTVSNRVQLAIGFGYATAPFMVLAHPHTLLLHVFLTYCSNTEFITSISSSNTSFSPLISWSNCFDVTVVILPVSESYLKPCDLGVLTQGQFGKPPSKGSNP